MPKRMAWLDRDRAIQTAPVVALFCTFFLLPPEVSISLAGVWLPAYRIALLIGLVFAFVRLAKAGGQYFSVPDALIAIVAVWILTSFSLIYGFGDGILRGGATVLDIIGSYLLARLCIRDFSDFRYFLMLVLPGLALGGGIMALESLSGNLLLRPTAAAIFGNVAAYSGGDATGQIVLREEVRLGLLRAYGAFSHPILGGLILGIFLPLFYFSGIRGWPWFAGTGAALAAVFSLSSAALLGLVIGLGAIGMDFVKRRIVPQLSWWTMLFMLGLLLFSLHMASKNGLVAVLSRLTLVPHTASYRLLIWEHGSKTVREHPWFGIGYQQWDRLAWMGESVDAHFLLLAMRHGLIVPILIIAAALYAMLRLGVFVPRLKPIDARQVLGVNIALAILLVAGQTVAFFGASNLVFMSLIGFAASLASVAGRPAYATTPIAPKGSRPLAMRRGQAHLPPARSHRSAG
ncbi:MAG: O-antigen ligase family protein [Pseudomonadota bacterium]